MVYKYIEVDDLLEAKKINILIADDHPAFREGLACLLRDESDFAVVSVAGDGEEAVESAKRLRPDVAIMDISMPKLNGIGAALQIRTMCPSTAVLILSAYSYQSYTLEVLRAGALGYLPKNTPLNKLFNAIRMVHSGEAVFNLKAIDKVLARFSPGRIEERKYPHELHTREVQVLKQVAKGISNKGIAGQLGISERTVQTHLVNIFNKLHVNSRTEAVLCSLKEGWLSPEDLMNEANG